MGRREGEKLEILLGKEVKQTLVKKANNHDEESERYKHSQNRSLEPSREGVGNRMHILVSLLSFTQILLILFCVALMMIAIVLCNCDNLFL